MASRRSPHCLALCAAVLFAVVATRQAAAQQPAPPPPIERSSVDYSLLNQPGPLWLPGADFSGQDLYGVNLAGANLREGKFNRAVLAQADLAEARLVLATLRNANLARADLQNATLSLADLRSANLPGADLSGAQMQGTLLGGAALDGALLAAADLRQSDLRRATLRSADLSHALLSGADLSAADLTDADLRQADLSNVNLAGANLAGANLDGVTYNTITVWPANFDVETMAMAGPLLAGDAREPPGGNGPERLAEQELTITMTLMPQMSSWFNQLAGPQDVSLVDRAQQISLLDEIVTGRKMVVFKSADMAEQLVPHTADKFDIIGYNLEHGPLNPLHEQADPVGSVVRMRALADAYGLDLALGPDHDFSLSHGAAMAPYVDIYAMQVQRVQSQPDLVRDFVVPMAEAVRAANPTIETSVQVRTEGEAAEIAALIDSVRGSIDGVAILSSPETTKTAMALIDLLREGGTRPAPVSDGLSTDPAEVAPAGQSTVWLRFLSTALQLLVVGLTLLFFLTAGRAVTSRRRRAD